MEISVLSFADYAQETAGKLTIVGIFDQINAPVFPFKYSFYLVGRFNFAPKEDYPRKIDIKVRYADDKKELFIVNGDVNQFKVNMNDNYSLSFLLNFATILFEKEGTYLFEIKTDNGFSTVIPLKVILSKNK